MTRAILAFLGVCAASVACWCLGHRQGQRVPFLGGHRCSSCGKPVDAEYVNPDRKQGPRAGGDKRFYRRGA